MIPLERMQAGTTQNFIRDLNNNFDAIKNELDKLSSQYPIGSVWIGGKKGAAPVNPASIFEGTGWKLIDKSFESKTINNTEQFIPIIEIDDSGKRLYPITCTACKTTRTGSTVRIQLILKIKDTDFTDSGATLGNFYLETVGVTKIPEGFNTMVIANDGANCAMVCKLHSDGYLEQLDLLGKSSLSIPSTAQTWSFDIMFNVPFSDMIDECCDKFYWVRTS